MEEGLTNKTAAQRLSEIRSAIHAVLMGGQSYAIGSRKLTRADLGLLRKMEKELQAEVAADESSGNGLFDDCYVAVWPWDR